MVNTKSKKVLLKKNKLDNNLAKSKVSKKSNIKNTRKKSNKSNSSKIKYKKLIDDSSNPSHFKKYYEKFHLPYKRKHTGVFYKDLFSLNGYYRYVWFPIMVLIFVLFFDFIIDLIVHNTIPAIFIYESKKSAIYCLLNIFFAFLNFGAYLTFAYESVKNNFLFKHSFPIVFKISIGLAFFNLLLILISFFSFLKDYLLLFNFVANIDYLFYLFTWAIINYIILLCVFASTYILFKKIKNKL